MPGVCFRHSLHNQHKQFQHRMKSIYNLNFWAQCLLYIASVLILVSTMSKVRAYIDQGYQCSLCEELFSSAIGCRNHVAVKCRGAGISKVSIRITPQYVHGYGTKRQTKIELHMPDQDNHSSRSPTPMDIDEVPAPGVRIHPFQGIINEDYDSPDELGYSHPPNHLLHVVPQGSALVSSWNSGTLNLLATFLGRNMHIINKPSSLGSLSMQAILPAARAYKNIVQSKDLQLTVQDPSPASVMAAHEEVCFSTMLTCWHATPSMHASKLQGLMLQRIQLYVHMHQSNLAFKLQIAMDLPSYYSQLGCFNRAGFSASFTEIRI